MLKVLATAEFDKWLSSLSDRAGAAAIAVRIRRLGAGNPGNVRAVGDGLSELKVDFGPGYRVYFKRTGREIVVLLCGGDKSTQGKDIRRAKVLASQL
jgi:putative addiction module killer protein